ncbi:WYL domain-containing protein [Altererythrobacter sp. TH136]|uniref:helix-turn-helix transcriptional regulator n=1 Tax=Altererythrobacter sp. TH136 TaxID=2067415 RepID=UPI0011635861|nr:WYL domain-containing protein [Altererythrobacter sp. TH136]QDM40646.1 WYL domain-containing protein [Altererythrobacter sp. TH136]
MRHYNTVKVLELAKALAGSGEGYTLDEMAEMLRANRRTAERMRDALRVIFPQMEEITSGRQKRFRISGGLDSFMQSPTAEELAELDAAAAALEASGGEARASLLRSVAGKIKSAQRPAVRRRVEPDLEALTSTQVMATQAGPRPLTNSDTLYTLRKAVLSGCQATFFYSGPAGAPALRTVEPYGFLYGKAYYLVGPEAGREDPVLWRLDRISEADLGAPCNGPPEDFDLISYAARSFGAFQEEPRAIRVRFDAEVAPSVERFLFHPSQEVERLPSGEIEVRFTAGGLLEIARHLMTWGGAVMVLEPPELKKILLAEVEAIRCRYRRSGPNC